MHKDIEKILITEEEIQAKVKELGALLTSEYEGKNPLVVGVLKGALPFMADLIKEMKIDLEIDFEEILKDIQKVYDLTNSTWVMNKEKK